MSKLHKIFWSVHITRASGSVLLWQQCYTLCASGFVDDIMFSHNGLYGKWRWQCRAGSNSHKFPMYSLGGATLCDLVSNEDRWGAATDWWLAECSTKARGKVCSLQLPCWKLLSKLDSMCWFSHRRSCTPSPEDRSRKKNCHTRTAPQRTTEEQNVALLHFFVPGDLDLDLWPPNSTTSEIFYNARSHQISSSYV